MDDMTRFEERFEERLRAFARTGIRSVDSAAVARVAADGHAGSDRTRPAPQRAGIGPWRARSMVKTVVAAAAAVAVLVSGAALLMTRDQPSIGGPTASASQPVVTSPSPTATQTPGPTPMPTPILWTEASLTEDWPAPVRAEPKDGAIVESLLVQEIWIDSGSCCLVNEPGRYVDPTGDTGSDAFPWLDIDEVVVGKYRVTINLASNQMPEVDPTEQWIAYGVVFDDDRDGVADRRFGMDFGVDHVRTWMTDLHTGRTLLSDGASIAGEYIDTTSPRSLRGYARFSFGGDTPRGQQGMELHNRPFYAWASVIQDGRVVATDYAPDSGWLKPSVQTKP